MKHLNRLHLPDIPKEILAILLVVAFLVALSGYVYSGISQYDALEQRYMVTTDKQRDDESEARPLTPSVEERMEYTLRDYPRAMAFLIVLFLVLSLWNIRQEAHMQAFLCALFLLLGIGCSHKVLYEGFYGLTGEAGFLVIGCVAMIAAFWVWRAIGQKLNPRLNQITYITLSVLIVVMLAANLFLIIQAKLAQNEEEKQAINGAYNWVSLFGIRLQPSEFIKAGLILLGSLSFRPYKRQVWYFALLLASCVVLMLARDIGALFVLALLFVAMVYLIYDDKRLMALILCVGLAAFCVLVSCSGTAHQRMENWGNAMTIEAYQQRDFISSVIRSGWLGLGIENASDFYWLYAGGTDGAIAGIQAIFGLPMVLIVMGCYMTLIMQCGVNRSLYPSSQPILFQMGIFMTAQILLNYCGSLDVLPFTGITAPLLSTGGSSTVVNMALMGVMAASLYPQIRIHTRA